MHAFGIYIINYLPPEPRFRAIRLEIHRKQLDWWIRNTPYPIYVIAMNYQPSDYYSSSRITYYDHPSGMTNISWRYRFDHFYNGPHDWGILLDDDAMLYDGPQHRNGHLLFSEMESHLEDYRGIDCFFPLNPGTIPFNSVWRKQPDIYPHAHVFERNLSLKGSMLVLRNLQKEGKQPIYNDPNFTVAEDHKFAIDLVASGYTVYISNNMLLKELRKPNASHFGHGKQNWGGRRDKIIAAYKMVNDQYQLDGMKLGPNQYLRRSNFIQKFYRAPSQLIIPKTSGRSNHALFDGLVSTSIRPKKLTAPR